MKPSPITLADSSTTRRHRWLGLGLAGILLAGIALGALLLAPPVQGWLVQRWVRSQPGCRIEFEKFSAGLSGVEVRGLKGVLSGMQVNIGSATIRLAALPLLKGELRVELADIQGLRIDVTPSELPPRAAASEPFAGILQRLQLPLRWSLVKARLEGEISIHGKGPSPIRGTFQIAGGGITSAQPGEFAFKLAFASGDGATTTASSWSSRGTVRVTQDPGHGVERVTVEGDFQTPPLGGLTLPTGKWKGMVTATGPGEEYQLAVDFGAAAGIEVTSQLDRSRGALLGQLTFRAKSALAASRWGEKIPSATLQALAEFAVDLRGGDLDVTLNGDFDLRDWARVGPQLKSFDAVKGKLASMVTRRGGRFSVVHFSAVASGETTPTNVRLELTGPINPFAVPTTPFALLAFEHWPLALANSWLDPATLQIADGEIGGAWSVNLSKNREWRLTPLHPVELTALRFTGPNLPPLPAARIVCKPQLEASSARAALTIDDFTATSAAGDRVTARLAATYDFESSDARARGEATALLPTLLAGANQTLPFILNAGWDVTHSNHQIRATILDFTARTDPTAPASLTVQLLQPVTLNLDTFAPPATTTTTDWARLTFHEFPLEWISRYIGRPAEGSVVEGDAVAQTTPDGQLTLKATTPWLLRDVKLGVGGTNVISGNLRVTPNFSYNGDHFITYFRAIEGNDPAGNRVTGEISVEGKIKERLAAARIEMEAELPKLPHSEGTFGALHAGLRARMHQESSSVVMVDVLELRIRNLTGELLTVTAPEPILFSTETMIVAATLTPLRLVLGEMPLEWLQPWIGGVKLGGALAPAEFSLEAQFTKLKIRPLKPVRLRGLTALINGRDASGELDFSVSPELDLEVICHLEPTFQLGYTGKVRFAQGSLEVTGRRAMDQDATIEFVGDDKRVFPSGLNLTARADLAEMNRVPALAQSGLPAAGTITTRVEGDLSGKAPLRFSGKIKGMPATMGRRTLPVLEFSGQGQLLNHQTLKAGVELRLATTPVLSDARFDVAVDLESGNLAIASAFKSNFLDLSELLHVARAFLPTTALAATRDRPGLGSSNRKRAGESTQLGVPFWSTLRGRFDLDLRAVQFGPYRIDGVRGRLEARDRELLLSSLSGEMFRGRWGGGVNITYDPANHGADHALNADFKIEQFDSARVVQTVFPNELASVDARIDVHSTVQSRGNGLIELINQADQTFTVRGKEGLLRLSVPKQEMAATAAVFGGAVLLSPELRALGRLLKKLAEMPVDRLRISGERTGSGEVTLTEFRIDSPQARLFASGKIPAVEGQPFLNRPLELSVDLAAKDEMAVILGGMSLIEKKPRDDGYRGLKEKFTLRGKAGQPDTRPLYDLLAKAVVGSKGTWGFLMRKIQAQVTPTKTAPKSSDPAISARPK